MKRVCLLLILFSVAGLSDAAAEGSGLSPAQLQAMEARLATINDPATKLFFKAGLERAKGEKEAALRTLSRLIVQHPQDEKWMVRSELLCAELYFDMGMLDAADVTARQVQFMNKGTEGAEKARLFREKIKQAKEQFGKLE